VVFFVRFTGDFARLRRRTVTRRPRRPRRFALAAIVEGWRGCAGRDGIIGEVEAPGGVSGGEFAIKAVKDRVLKLDTQW
jgi:hypothetical protein